MEVVDVWTGQRANALQRALRFTNEAFAERLGVNLRTVAKWHARPEVQLSPEMQEALDTVLFGATEQAKARFGLMMTAGTPTDPDGNGDTGAARDKDLIAAEQRLNSDAHIAAALEWLDASAGWTPGTARKRVAAEVVQLDASELGDRTRSRGRVQRADVAAALSTFYGTSPDGHGTYRATYGNGREVATSVLTHTDWLDIACPLQPDNDRAALAGSTSSEPLPLDDVSIDGAVRRTAETLGLNTTMVDAPLYRLIDVDVGKQRIGGTFGLASFVQYALTMDLLEAELADALATGREPSADTLPLRTRLMPDTASVLDTRNRMCAGGTLALTAIARPPSGRRTQPDYLLLVQERGGKVLNAASRLAVIPKSFHGPLTDYSDDTQIGSTLRRELEEELFGRDDVDSTLTSSQRHADPMHASRLSPPMAWLAEHDTTEHWQMECTSFGLNLVSGNYEFASLIVIHDETFWTTYGGDIAANWESESLRRYSSLDRDLLEDLIGDRAWSNEGLFALLQGLRRLAQVGGNRVDVPAIEWEVR